MKLPITLALCCIVAIVSAQTKTGYHLIKTFHIASSGGWDYLATNGKNLYVSHGSQVNILDKNTGDSVGMIPQTAGVHGIAFDNNAGLGYTSNGRLNNVTVFNLKDASIVAQIPTGENPDAIMYDGFSKKIITCNGRSNDLSVIDPVSRTVIATIPVGGKPETAVSDGAGKWYVNIEDKGEIMMVDAVGFTVEKRWAISPGESPTGLAIDLSTHQLFAGCEKMLLVVDALTGKVKQHLPIGDGCDGVVFDKEKSLVFTSNGEGTITIIQEKPSGECTVLENIPTKQRARTIGIDTATHLLYLPTAEFDPLPPSAAQGTRPNMKLGTFQVLVFGSL